MMKWVKWAKELLTEYERSLSDDSDSSAETDDESFSSSVSSIIVKWGSCTDKTIL
jgi:hypothetical protein